MGADLSQIEDGRFLGSSAVGALNTSKSKLLRSRNQALHGSKYGQSMATDPHRSHFANQDRSCTNDSNNGNQFAHSGIGNLWDRSLFQPKGKSSIATPQSNGMDPSSVEIAHNSSTNTMNALLSGDDQMLESLDIPVVEWEGYVTKRGHLVRNWKMRFFTLEGNRLSYYESKVDAQQRAHLKGRVKVASVRIDQVSKWGSGYEFTFSTTEGKIFHCSVSTPLEQVLWVYFLEAGIGCANMKLNDQISVSSVCRHDMRPNRETRVAYDMIRRILQGEYALLPDFMAYFNKDLVFSSSYSEVTPQHGDFFGREGLLQFFSIITTNFEVLETNVVTSRMDDHGTSFTFKGQEQLRCRMSGEIIRQNWTHRIRYGPYGRIFRLKIEVEGERDWNNFNWKNPYPEMSSAAIRSNRALSISLKDFNVYNVIGKGGFGTVVNAVKKSDGQIYAIKILEKSKMTKYDIESSFTEMRVAQNIHHPFIAGLRIAFQSRTKLFLGMNYYGGGDLFHHMSKGNNCRIPSERAHFYAAELVLGIHHLHKHNILYRDIKPENVMIDGEGHIALVDFGLAKLHVSEYKGAKTMAGSPQYTAPELLLPKSRRSYGKAADWWSLGILLYEMSVGTSPFYDNNVDKMYKKIQYEPLVFPSKPVLAPELKGILSGLLQKDPLKRLGTQISDILKHPYFMTIDWDLLVQKRIIPPWRPHLSSPLDVRYVDNEFTELDAKREVLSPTVKSSKLKSGFFMGLVSIRNTRKSPIPPAQDPTFKDFTYYCENPDALVEVDDLVDELRPDFKSLELIEENNSFDSSEVPEKTVRSIQPTKEATRRVSSKSDMPFSMEEMLAEETTSSPHSVSSSSENADPYEALSNDPNIPRESSIAGTPLCSFLEQGSLSRQSLHPCPDSDMRPIGTQSGLHRLEVEMVESFGRVEVTLSRPFIQSASRVKKMSNADKGVIRNSADWNTTPHARKAALVATDFSHTPASTVMEVEF